MTEPKQTLMAATLKKIKAKSKAGCFMCGRVLEALDEEHQLRDWPLDRKEGKSDYPVEAQRYHILKEVGKQQR